MPEIKKFEDVLPSLRQNQSIMFEAPVVVKGNSALFFGQQRVHAQYVAGLLHFIDDDPYFKVGHRVLRPNQIREDQQVVV